ncbi:hypothetical protein TNIN_96771 [Trichonephila inaurata madagascariensis]|uniref:Uncharacterized protein n=1 Tax=Trichonephila inaurata madagascariensis TaxID=2747483 RepID=A0A8X6J9Y7_9ARAC|nr:hypothetical protein TNIN_96771 [Trichonephila inaurata madagascariensis]
MLLVVIREHFLVLSNACEFLKRGLTRDCFGYGPQLAIGCGKSSVNAKTNSFITCSELDQTGLSWIKKERMEHQFQRSTPIHQLDEFYD